MTQFSDERGAELRELFFDTAQELLQALNEEALKLEKDSGDTEAVRTLRRSVHTLKGDAAACGFRELSELAHEFEDALALDAGPSQSSVAEVAFAAVDVFAAMLAAYRGQLPLPSASPLRKMIRELAKQPGSRKPGKKKSPSGTAAGKPALTEYENLAIQNAFRQGRKVYQITAQLDPLNAMPIAARQLLLNAVSGAGELLGTPPDSNLPQATKRIQILLSSAMMSDQIAAKCRIPTVVADVTVVEIANPKQTSESPRVEPESVELNAEQEISTQEQSDTSETDVAPSHEESEGRAQTSAILAENILRVDAERIDSVLNLVGELIIGKSMLQRTVNEFSRRYPKEEIRGRFADALAFQSRVLGDLQRSVMKVRMVPVEQLFRRFPRMLRDVARQCGKEVEMVVSGQDTDLDKSLLDAIAEPLTHIVRNAVSHGIESPAERLALGKPERGTVRLDAYHQGNQVIVEVSDDGRGINLDRVKAKAVEQKLVSPAEAAAFGEREVLGLLFRPGFSTALEITEVSGRGVGLDVVQNVLQRLKGTVEVVSRPGQGTTFRLKLPLTLAIIKALLFRVQQRLYAISLNTVAEIARATEAEVHQVDNYEVLQLRGQVLPLVRLGQAPNSPADRSHAKLFVLVITLGDHKLGLIVEGLEGEEELVIKAVDDRTVATNLVSGASILGDGRVVLILNLPAVIERSSRMRAENTGQLCSGLLLTNAGPAQASAAMEVTR